MTEPGWGPTQVGRPVRQGHVLVRMAGLVVGVGVLVGGVVGAAMLAIGPLRASGSAEPGAAASPVASPSSPGGVSPAASPTADASPSPSAAALAAVPEPPAWTVILASLDDSTRDQDDARARAVGYLRAGVADVGVLHSDNFGSLNRGYWVVFGGRWDNPDAASDYCDAILAEGMVDACYPRELANG